MVMINTLIREDVADALALVARSTEAPLLS